MKLSITPWHLPLLLSLFDGIFSLPSNKNFPRTLSTRTPRDADWNACVQRGTTDWAALQSAVDPRGQHTDSPVADLRYYQSTPNTNQPPPGGLATEMAKLSNSIPLTGYTKIQLSKPHAHGDPVFENLYHSKVIIAKDNQRWRDEVDPENQRVNWPEVAFANYHALAPSTHFPTTGLSWVIQYFIGNEITVEILRDIYTSARRTPRQGEWDEWTYAHDRDEFLAILGTPVGCGATRLLTQHATALGKKVIATIYTLVDGPAAPSIAFRFRAA